MLHQTEAKNVSFLEQFTNIGTKPSITAIELLNTVKDDQFPGAIIPTEECYYIAASSQKDWSIISTLVKSFIGLSFSDFNEIKKKLDGSSEVEKFILKQDLPFVTKVLISSDKDCKAVTEVSFKKMYTLYQSSPNKHMQILQYIDSVIENFKQALFIQDIGAAQRIISQIKSESRLDALNLKFMEIELSYSTNNWEAIINDNLINQIINSRKPLRIRLHIIEAFFYAYILPNLVSENSLLVYTKEIRSKLVSLLFNCPANATDGVKYIFILAYLNNDIQIKEIEKLRFFIETNKYLSHDVKLKLQEKISLESTTSLDEDRIQTDYILARASVINANNTDTIEAIESVHIKLEYLQGEDQNELIKESIHFTGDNGNVLIPHNWIEWLSYLSNEAFKNSGVLAEHALEEWPIEGFITDPTDVKTICNAIESLEEDFAIQRFIYSLPLFIESFKRSGRFPNPMLVKMYISILEIITVHDIQDQATLVISQEIVETLLQISPNRDQYIYLLSMVDSIVDKTNGRSFINWLLDYAELLISENAVDIIVRDKTLENVLTKLFDQKQWLQEYQLKLIFKLASLVGIEKLFDDIIENDEVYASPWNKYKDKTIGIYTLSENAARHAKEYLEENIDNVKILLNHDKAATEALRHLAHTSDYLVLVTQVAKHAATGEIQKILRQKGVDPLFPIGKGSSSIISVLLGGE
jgi:hypothetical protein